MKVVVLILCLAVLPIVVCGCGGATLKGKISVTASVKQSSVEQSQGTTRITISREQLAGVIEPRSVNIQGCYEIGLSGHRDLSGKLIVRFRIQPGGAVSDVWITRNDLTPEVGECISELFTSLQFPYSENARSILVEYPLNLAPAN